MVMIYKEIQIRNYKNNNVLENQYMIHYIIVLFKIFEMNCIFLQIHF